MIRTITGFHQDGQGDWVADLSCLHRQHVRHRPPFQERPWALDPQQRAARVGSEIECPLCDRTEMPDGLRLLRTAGPWDHDSLPAGLRHSHRTAPGVWALLQVIEGRVGFRMETAPPLDVVLERGAAQPIPPAVAHEVSLTGPARLVVQFWGKADR
ncbi:MAG: DUF3565 domain-containing protein [Acidimicrobiales bacterium]